MLAHDAAAAHSVNADLCRFTFAPLGVPVIYIVVGNRGRAAKLICNHQRRAAGRIQLVMVMLFDDLYVEICPQHSVGLFGKLDEQIDAQRHVRTLEHRYGF